MSKAALEKILEITSRENELESAVQYLVECFTPIVKSCATTVICFPRNKKTDFGFLAGEAVKRCGGEPVFWEDDFRWKTLLSLAFRKKASTIIAPPLVVLGMTKIARYEKIPLYFYNVVMSGYPCLDWIMDGISKGLDCKHAGLFAPEVTSILAGFACGCGTGIHLWDEKYDAEILGEKGEILPYGSRGQILLRRKDDRQAFIYTKTLGAFQTHPCLCGNPAPKLVDIGVKELEKTGLMKAAEQILLWSSVLDCVFRRTPYGLELEVVCFPGEALPKFPSCAKLQIRSWNPERDCPLPLGAGKTLW